MNWPLFLFEQIDDGFVETQSIPPSRPLVNPYSNNQRPFPMTWSYFILTVSNDLEATAYRRQLDLRQRLDLLHAFDQVTGSDVPERPSIGLIHL